MAGLYFAVGADFQKLQQLKKDLEDLKSKLKGMDSAADTKAFDTLNKKLQQMQSEFNKSAESAARAGAVYENNLKTKIQESSGTVNELSRKIIEQKAIIKDIESDVNKLGEAYRKLSKSDRGKKEALSEWNASKKSLLEEKAALFALQQKQSEARLTTKELREEYSRYTDSVRSSSKATDNASDSLLNYIKKGAALAGITFGVDKIKDLGSEIINVRNQFQQLEIAFGTMLKSKDKAATLMKDLTKFAAETPFGLQSAASGAKQLLAYGSTADTVIKELTMLGDVAAGTGQQIGDLVYLYGTLRTQGRAYLMDIRQFAGRGIPIYDELAKVLNTSKDKVNDFVSAGKVGFKEVELAFKNMTAQGGLYGGLMEQQSKSIGGRLEALKDNIDSIFNTIGKDSEGLIYKSIDGLNTLVENYETVGKVLLGLVATYGIATAAEKFHIAMMMVQATSTTTVTGTKAAQIVVTNALTAAQDRLNASMLANPYVLAAAAVVALGYGIYKLATYQTEAEKAQSRLNETTKEYESNIEGEKVKLDILFGRLKSAKEGTDKYKEAKQGILDIADSYHLSISKDIDLVKEETKYRNILNAAIIETAKAKAIESGTQKATEIYTKTWGDAISDIRERFIKTFGESQGELLLDSLKESLSEGKDLTNEVQDAIGKFSTTYYGSSVTGGGSTTLNPVQQLVTNVQLSKKTLEKEVSDLEGVFGKLKKSTDEDSKKTAKALQDQIFSATKNVQDLKNELKDLQKGIIPDASIEDASFDFAKTIEEKTKSLKEAEDKLSYLLYGKSSSGQSKADKSEESAAEKAKKISQELLVIQSKLSNEQIRQQIESDQKSIDRQEDGFNKQFEQNKLNYKKELQQIKEFEAEKAKERAEAILKFGKDNVPDNLSEANIKVQVDTMKNDALLSFDKANSDTLKNLTDKYQSYADQRLDIEKKFNKDIDDLIKLRDKAQEKGDKESVDKLNRSIAKATADKGKDLISFDFERMKEAPEYIRAFEDLGTTSSETLNSLLGQFEKYKEEAAKVLSPKELREYTTTIQSIADELSSRDLYGSLIKQKDEAVKANQRLIKAENDLRLVQLGIGDPLLTEEEAIKRVNKAKDEYYNKNKKVLDTQKKIRDQVSALAKEMSGLGNALGGTSGEIISFIGDITSFYTTASEGIEKVSQTGAQAISVVEKASVILTIISTAIQLMKQLNSILPDAFSQYEKYDEKIERINDMRDAVNEYEIAVLKANQAENSWFGNDSLRNLKDYKELQTKIFDSYRDKMLEEQAIYENKGSGGWLTNSLKSAVSWVSKITYGFDLLNKKYKEGTTAAVNNLRIETRKKSSGFLGSGIGGKSQKTEDLVTWTKNNLGFDLFDADGWINEEAYDVIMSKYSDKLVGQTKETLEELKALKEQYDEYLDQLHEYVNSLYEPLIGNMVDSLWDWLDEGKNALDSFKDYAKDTFRDIVTDMMKTIVLEKVVGSFQDDIANLYEQYSAGKLTEDELARLVSERTGQLTADYENNLPGLQATLSSINDAFKGIGIDLKDTDSTSQSSSKGSFETITQDQAGEMNGRLTGIMETNLRSEGYLKSISEWNQPISDKIDMSSILMPLNLIKESSTKIEQMIEENKSIAIHSYYELRDINKNTKELYQIREDIASLRKDGIKVK